MSKYKNVNKYLESSTVFKKETSYVHSLWLYLGMNVPPRQGLNLGYFLIEELRITGSECKWPICRRKFMQSFNHNKFISTLSHQFRNILIRKKELWNGHNSQFAITCNTWMVISRQNLHTMIPCKHLSDFWYRVSQNSIYFFQWPLRIFLNNKQKLQFFKLL